MAKRTVAAPELATLDNVAEVTPVSGDGVALHGLPLAVPDAEEAASVVSPFGEVPRTTTYWGIQRASIGGAWDVLSWGAPSDPVELREWPIADLGIDAVRERWGAGTYRVQWLTGSDRGGRKHLNYGRTFTLRAVVPPAPAPVVAAPASPFGPEMDRMLQMQRMIGQEATEKMTSVLQFAAALSARPASSGLGAAELELILQKQAAASAAQTKELVTALLAPINAKLEALEGDDEDEDEGGGVAKAAAIGAGLIKGKGWLPMVLNWANGNPEVAKEVVKHGLPIVASAATKIAEVISGPRPSPPLPVAVPDLRPHHVNGGGVIAPTAGPPEIEQGSLRAWPSSPPAPPGGPPTS